MGILGGPNHINPIVHSAHVQENITCATLQITLIIPAQRVAVPSTDALVFHILPRDKIEKWGACGPGDWPTTINPSVRNCLIINVCTFLLQCGGPTDTFVIKKLT
jgi:hypothetical protein